MGRAIALSLWYAVPAFDACEHADFLDQLGDALQLLLLAGRFRVTELDDRDDGGDRGDCGKEMLRHDAQPIAGGRDRRA